MKRIFHTYEKWECYPAGFYEEKPAVGLYDDYTKTELEKAYAEFLSDSNLFRLAALRVIKEWPNSCEHYLSNENMNRIAWIGQAAACIELHIPSAYRGGFHRLSKEQQDAADGVALEVLNAWLTSRGEKTLAMAEAASKTEANLY